MALLAWCLCAGHSTAQQLSPASPHMRQRDALKTRVRNIRFDWWAGFCSGYCCTTLDVQPDAVSLTLTTVGKDYIADYKLRYPDQEVRADLSDKHWRELEQLVDRDALFALPDTIGHPGAVDDPIESVELKFSDGARKRVTFSAAGNPPAEIEPLIRKLWALQLRLEKELPPGIRFPR
ncbi:MAG TPA: hypothetical protein VEJ38_15780 [Candidatus Acidoferrales bacterium]|nr:hypothetical protein [Candidatus Acidoferrales bacterium]